MRWKYLIPLLVLALCFLFGAVPSQAQTYSFVLDREEVDVWINKDGSVSLEYWLTFTCDQGDHIIEAVDVGLPTDQYDLSGVRADLDGKPAQIGTDFQGSGSYGFAVHLGVNALGPGQTGTVHVQVDRVGGMVYEDDQDKNYASTAFIPVYFSSDYVHGSTDLVVRFHLPPGVQPNEPRWHSSPSGWPQSEPIHNQLDSDGRVLYIWENSSAAPDQAYTFGASFPRKYVDEAAIQKPPSALAGFFSSLAGCLFNPITIVVGIIVVIVVVSWRAQASRRMSYLPPSMQVEGVGIKRGLTAVEAAIVLQTPLNKVLTMVLFGLLKKGALTVLEDDPLKVQINQPLPQDLRPYEQGFLDAVKSGTPDESRMHAMMVDLVKSVNNQMKGFSRKETTAYYRDIVQRAWQQVEGAQTPEMRGQMYGEGLEWTMLDDDFKNRTERTFREGPVFVPIWWGYYRPWARTMPAGTPAPSAAPAGAPSAPMRMPSLPGADFAARMVRGIEGTAGRIVHSLPTFTGKVTSVTNPPPKPSYSSSTRSSGGGHCACACACACAGCACACAGGGR